MAERNEHERDQKEIERVQRPTKKAGDKRIPLFAIERFEEPDRFHCLDLIADLTIEKPGLSSGERTRPRVLISAPSPKRSRSS